MMAKRLRWGACLALVLAAAGAGAQGYGPSLPGSPPRPRPQAPQGATGNAAEVDRHRLAAAADRLAPQRPGIVDAYVVVAALDTDPVFGREAREAGRVLAQHYDAEGRTLVLAGIDGHSIDPSPRGSPDTLAIAIARVAALMNPAEDALILYVTAHGSPAGVAYRDQGNVLATVTPDWLAEVLARAGVRNRAVIVSACFSGVFVPRLASADGAVITAAAADRTSFGCASDNDWTFFGDALVNHALRRKQPLAAAFGEARGLVAKWDGAGKLIPSNPQIALGAHANAWLEPLEARAPKQAGAPVGRPATDALDRAVAANH